MVRSQKRLAEIRPQIPQITQKLEHLGQSLEDRQGLEQGWNLRNL